MVEQANVPLYQLGNAFEEETAPPRPACPEPHLWTRYDALTPEVEVCKLIRSLVRTIKPKAMVCVGDKSGVISSFLAQGARENGFGKVTVCGIEQACVHMVGSRLHASGLLRYAEVLEGAVEQSGIAAGIDFLFVHGSSQDSGNALQYLVPLMEKGLWMVHDPSRCDYIHGDEQIFLPTPRGLAIEQKR